MGIFSFIKSSLSEEKLTANLVNYVYDSVQDDKGIRVEDALCVISTIVAERCIEVANEYSINEHEFEPGSAVFSEKMNEVLIGPVAVESWNDLPAESVFAKIKEKIKRHYEDESFPSLIGIFEDYAGNVGETEWGKVPLSIPDDHKPTFFPLQVGYETRKFIEKNIDLESKEKTLQIAINAIAQILIEVKAAMDPALTLTLTFELINGMAKTATMTDKKVAELKAEMKK